MADPKRMIKIKHIATSGNTVYIVDEGGKLWRRGPQDPNFLLELLPFADDVEKQVKRVMEWERFRGGLSDDPQL
jgi:hypothetical protein